jgi:hypothetical protein
MFELKCVIWTASMKLIFFESRIKFSLYDYGFSYSIRLPLTQHPVLIYFSRTKSVCLGMKAESLTQAGSKEIGGRVRSSCVMGNPHVIDAERRRWEKEAQAK